MSISLRIWAVLALAAFAVCAVPAAAAAPSKKWTFSGNIRSYYFTRSFRQGTNQYALSLGGNFHLEGNLFRRFGGGLTWGTANPLGFEDSNAKKIDSGLPGTTLSTLEAAYLQYRSDGTLLRFGRQTIKTPWAHLSDSRMVPNAFQGVLATANLSKSWTFVANRMVRFKSRTSSSFDTADVLSNAPTAGMLAAGFLYDQPHVGLQAWYYDFYGTAQMAYVEATERLATTGKFRPYISGQYIAEAGHTLRLPASVNSHTYGINLGIAHDRGDVSLSYNNVPFARGSYEGGGIASPYTYKDTDPLFTTSTGTGLVDLGAGHAYRLAGTVWSYHNRLRAIASRGEYYLYGPSKIPNNHALVTNIDVTCYMGNGRRGDTFRGLSLRNRWIDVDTPGSPFTFINNRTQLEYDF